MNSTLKHGIGHALLTTLYIAGIATFFTYAQQLFGSDVPDQKTVLIPIVMLLLFVLSAAITSTLVFGRPVLLYLDGKKSEALAMLGYTLASLFVILFIAAIVLAVVK